jgi:hypothetical protein
MRGSPVVGVGWGVNGSGSSHCKLAKSVRAAIQPRGAFVPWGKMGLPGEVEGKNAAQRA